MGIFPDSWSSDQTAALGIVEPFGERPTGDRVISPGLGSSAAGSGNSLRQRGTTLPHL